MTFLRTLFLVMACVVPLAGCDSDDGAVENMGEKVDNAVDETGDSLDDAADSISDSAEDACEEATDENC